MLLITLRVVTSSLVTFAHCKISPAFYSTNTQTTNIRADEQKIHIPLVYLYSLATETYFFVVSILALLALPYTIILFLCLKCVSSAVQTLDSNKLQLWV